MKRILLLFIVLTGFFSSCEKKNQESKDATLIQEVFVTSEGAIGGYDAVAYFKVSMPVKGSQEFTHDWNGATWRFSSAENLEVFKSDPEKYAPQFGGYCAYGTADGHKAPTQPDAWAIVNEKLYLNYNKDVQVIWKKDQNAMIDRAEKNWPLVKLQKF